jgi:hypothetical protein
MVLIEVGPEQVNAELAGDPFSEREADPQAFGALAAAVGARPVARGQPRR